VEEEGKASEHILLPLWFPFPMKSVDKSVVWEGESKAPEQILLSPCSMGVSTHTAGIFESAQASEHILLPLVFTGDTANESDGFETTGFPLDVLGKSSERILVVLTLLFKIEFTNLDALRREAEDGERTSEHILLPFLSSVEFGVVNWDTMVGEPTTFIDAFWISSRFEPTNISVFRGTKLLLFPSC
jgi:hypothetical protein